MFARSTRIRPLLVLAVLCVDSSIFQFVFADGKPVETVPDDGNVGCLFSEKVCTKQQLCFDDYAFGRCLPKKGKPEKYQYTFDKRSLGLLSRELRRLFTSGYRWNHVYTQCVVKNLLASIRTQAPYDPSLCQNTQDEDLQHALRILEAQEEPDPQDLAVIRYKPSGVADEEWAEEIYFPTPDEPQPTNEVKSKIIDQNLYPKTKRKGLDSTSEFDSNDPLDLSDLTAEELTALLRVATEIEEEEEIQRALDQIIKAEAEKQLEDELFEKLMESDEDYDPIEFPSVDLDPSPKEIEEIQNYLASMENENWLSFPDNGDFLKRPPRYDVKKPGPYYKVNNYLKDWDGTEDKEYLEKKYNEVTNRDVDEDIEDFSNWLTSELSDSETKNTSNKRSHIPWENSDYVLEVPVDDDSDDYYRDYLEESAPDAEYTKSILRIDKSGLTPWYNDDDPISTFDERNAELESYKNYLRNLEKASRNQEYPELFLDSEVENLSNINRNKLVSPMSDSLSVGPKQQIRMPVLRTTSAPGESMDKPTESQYDIIDSSYAFISTKNNFRSWKDGNLFVKALEKQLRLPEGTFTNIRVDKNQVTFKVNRNDRGLNASEIAVKTDQVKGLLEKRTGNEVVATGIGDQTKISMVGLEHDDTRLFMWTFITCGTVVGVLAAAGVFYVVRKHSKSRDKLQALGHTDTEASQDYQDLCRQRMIAKSNEKPEPIHVGKHQKIISSLSRESETSVKSPSSRSSTSSWNEEPVTSNMDISTGHMVLSYMEDHLKNKDRLEQEWLALCAYEAEPCSVNIATQDNNMARNRYEDMLPYDHSRVVLNDICNMMGSDYINASTITDHDPRNPAYIATQGPLPHTAADFWQMVWEQGSVVVVNLT